MNQIRNLLIGLFLGVIAVAKGQEHVLQGKITNEEDVEGIHIINRTTRFNSVTDEHGNFSIEANRNDTLYISSVHYVPDRVVITEDIYEKGLLIIRLEALVNELSEVVLGPNLTGNITTDLRNIKTEKPINFDDVGIPGFKGIPEEKIVPMVPYVGLATAVDLEAMYKHLSGYYRKLKLKRKWEGEHILVANLIQHYTCTFFEEAYAIPKDRLYDFLLYCIETTELKKSYEIENYSGVLEIFKTKSEVYTARLLEKEE